MRRLLHLSSFRRLFVAAVVAVAAGSPSFIAAQQERFDARRESVDLYRALMVRSALLEEESLAALNLGVDVKNRVVTIWGAVPTREAAARAVRIAEAMPDVLAVRNHMIVEQPNENDEFGATTVRVQPNRKYRPPHPIGNGWETEAATKQVQDSNSARSVFRPTEPNPSVTRIESPPTYELPPLGGRAPNSAWANDVSPPAAKPLPNRTESQWNWDAPPRVVQHSPPSQPEVRFKPAIVPQPNAMPDYVVPATTHRQPAARPVKRFDATLTDRVETVRRRNARYRSLSVSVVGGRAFIAGSVWEGRDAHDLARELSRLPGVRGVVVGRLNVLSQQR